MEPQLKGVVVITLPPMDDPCKGKTITAKFSLEDPPLSELNDQNPSQRRPPIEQRRMPLRSSRVFRTKRAITLIGVALLFCLLWQYGFPRNVFEFEDDGLEEEETESFLYTLYSKSDRGFQQKAYSKLGMAVRKDQVNRGIADQFTGISSTTNSSTVFPLKGNIYPDGLFYISVLVGNPPRPYYLDVDTGSDLTWIQCDAPCTSCAKGPHPLYRPTKGKIVSPRDSLCIQLQLDQSLEYCEPCHQCDYEITYADHGSSMGVLVRDTLHLMITNGTSTKAPFGFGCAYDQQGTLLASPAKTDGIVGLSSSKVSLPSQLASQGIVKNVVGHCIASDMKEGGYMFFGDDYVPFWRMNWVPMLTSSSIKYYHSEIAKISVGGKNLDVMAGMKFAPVVFDSGSSYTYLTSEAYTGLIVSLKYVTSYGFVLNESDTTLPVCWQAKVPIRSIKEVEHLFKPLTLHIGKNWWFGSKDFEMTPENYLVLTDNGNICLGILDGSKIHDGTFILGDVSLHGKLVVYDNVKQRIGWTSSDCKKPRKVKSFPFF